MRDLFHSKKTLFPFVLAFLGGLIVMGAVWFFETSNSALSIESANTSGSILDVASSTGDSYLTVTSNGKVGIDNQIPQTALDVYGMIRLYTATTSATKCTNAIEGAIDYDAYYKHFFGCDGTAWRQLDNK